MAEQAVFIGEREHVLDEKNRVTLPSKFREAIRPQVDGETFFVTIGLEGCLFLYTAARWKELSARIAQKPFTMKNAREFQRLFFGNAEEVEPDKAGRVLIPDHLIMHAGLTKDVIVMGVVDRIEIWDSARWRQTMAANAGKFESMAEELFRPDANAE